MSLTENPSELRRHGDSMVRPGDADHAVNVLAGGPPPWVQAAIGAADVTRYPDPGPAITAVAEFHHRRPEEVVITNGASEALWLLGPALAPRRAVLIQPGFTETEAALHAHEISATRLHSSDEVPADADLVVVTNPTSPDGRLRDRADVLALLAPGRTVVVDEAFMSMVPGETESLSRELHGGLIVVRSLTKLLSVPGLRVGYALAPPPLAALLRRVQPPWSANAAALSVLAAMAEHPHELVELAMRAAAEREDLTARLHAIDAVTVYPSSTNFVLIEVPDGPALVERLAELQIAVRPAASFPGFSRDHLRITARDGATNARLVAAIANCL